MSQATKGKKHPAKADKAHGDKSASGAAGDKKGTEAVEKKTTKTGVTESHKTQASGTSSSSKVQPPSTAASKTPTMKPSETKASSSQQKMSGPESHKKKRNKKQATQKAKAEAEKAAQLAKTQLDASSTKHPHDEKQRDSGEAKSPSKPSTTTEPEKTKTDKAASDQTGKPATQLISKEEPKAKSDNKPLSGEVAVTAVAGGGAGLMAASAESKEDKSASVTPAVADCKPIEKSDLDTALDDLIDTLGGPEENNPPAPAYTGPEISEDPLSSLYIEELGKRESTIPPEYRKLLESKGDGKVIPPQKAVEKAQPTITDDDLADALSSDFTCSTLPSAGEKSVAPKEKKPAEEGDLLQAQSLTLVSSSAPPKEKKPKLEEVEITDSALDALVDTLGMPELEPEEDLSSIVEVEEPKAKERKEKKPGERDDTLPPEYRLKPVLDKDGKPLLPEPEEKPKPISESDLVDEFSKDFASSSSEMPEPSKPAAVSAKSAAADPPKASKEKVTASPTVPSVQPPLPSGVSTKPSVAEPKKVSTETVISAAAVHSVQSSAPTATSPGAQVPDEALEALSGSLGKREPDPEGKKPAVDKVKEKAKQETREKLGEDEETIPPDYRLVETKDKDGKPLLPKPEEKPKPLSESELLDALSEGFSSSPPASEVPTPVTTQKSSGNEEIKPAVTVTEETISSASASAVHSSTPQPPGSSGQKERDDAADLLADSLGQREPDPDEHKPVVDKVKEKAKSEHRDKLGERDDTIPPDYRHILDSDEKGKPVKPKSKDGEKSKEKKPADEAAAIDALSGDFDNSAKLPLPQQPSTKDEKTKDAATPKSAKKNGKKSKASKKAKEQSSSAKSEKQKKS